MAATDFGALEAARKIVWERMIWQDGRDVSFWFGNGFVGKGNADTATPVHFVNELTATSKGDKCVMQLVQDLTGDGIAGDTPMLVGNEEELVNDEQEIVIDTYANAVRSKGPLARQATVINFRRTGRTKLGYWIGDKTDEMGFLTAAGIKYTKNLDGSDRAAGSHLPKLAFAADVTAPTDKRISYAGSASSTSTLTAADKVNWNLIVQNCAFAKRARIKPVRVDGKRTYHAVLSTEALRDLKQDPVYQQNVRTAGPRGSTNPLFTKAVAMIDDIVIHESNRVPTTLGLGAGSKWGAGGTVDGAHCLFLGAQAVGFAEIKGDGAGYEELAENDYKRRQGIAIQRMIGLLKPRFDSIYDKNTAQDFGVVVMRVAAAAS